MRVDLTKDSDLLNVAAIHDNRGGPRAAYAYALGRTSPKYVVYPMELTADLDTNEVEDFIIRFYTAFNKRFGPTY
jgi:hypothetical protein